uniref:YitT family protein n=1 Tax=candidate division WOR-3 bacterium TaxID=2052148 RepID=A0A7C2P4H0_UNCW3
MRNLREWNKKLFLKINWADVVVITLGTLITAIGIVLFLAPNKIAAGGVSGIGVILFHLFRFPIGLTMLVINTILFIIAFILLGSEFGLKSIYASVILSVFIDLLEYIFPKSLYVNDLVIATIFGNLLTGFGIALVVSRGASTGGTDIVAMLIKKYTNIDMGKALMVIDFTITLFAGILFGKVIGMYSLLAVIINTNTIDYVLEGITTSFQAFIITVKHEIIKERILKEIGRGVTLIRAIGGYTGEERFALWVILKSPREIVKLKEIVKEEDPTAFITITHVREVLGEGFKRISSSF